MNTGLTGETEVMLDWREGERWFMENLIDGDFAAKSVPSPPSPPAREIKVAEMRCHSNGGWQWSASTGTDPQPYFRIFAPLSQSEKSDPGPSPPPSPPFLSLTSTIGGRHRRKLHPRLRPRTPRPLGKGPARSEQAPVGERAREEGVPETGRGPRQGSEEGVGEV